MVWSLRCLHEHAPMLLPSYDWRTFSYLQLNIGPVPDPSLDIELPSVVRFNDFWFEDSEELPNGQ